MIADFHFLRPLWLLTLVPYLALGWHLCRQSSLMTTWRTVCDPHLLPYLIQTKSYNRQTISQALLLMSLLLLIISISGPTWSRLPVPTYQPIQPRVVVLDMSDAMLIKDLSPDRLSRAKFKLHDLFQYQSVGQFGLVVYTGEPFVVSPLTDDGQTIDALLAALTPDVMPVEGQQLSSALEQAAQLITQAGFQHGQILVLTATSPSREAISASKTLAGVGINTSIMPIITTDTQQNPLFEEFAHAGQGEVIPLSNTSTDLDRWLKTKHGRSQYTSSTENNIPVWRDQGPWFLIPALIFLLPAFRRGWQA